MSSTPGAHVAAELRQLLGARLAAYIAGVSRTAIVRAWAEGIDRPDAAIQRRLEVSLEAARIVESAHGRQMTQAWFHGLNPELDDRSPARALLELPTVKAVDLVIAAARQFAAK